MFELKSGVNIITTQTLTIQSQNIIDCLRLFMENLSFQENQVYQLSYIYN